MEEDTKKVKLEPKVIPTAVIKLKSSDDQLWMYSVSEMKLLNKKIGVMGKDYCIGGYRTPAIYLILGVSVCAHWSFLAFFHPKYCSFWTKTC